jgi:predicted adenylyl cyclase CyaB
MTEIEVKIRIGDPKAVRERLLGLGAVVTRERHLEKNVLFDFATGALRAARRALRLRTTGKRATLTFKGEPQKSRSFKVRKELETQVRDPRELRKILRELGLKETFAYEKHRTVLRKSRLTICIDETTVGTFLELEGERHEITRFARALKFDRADFITRDYVEMIAERSEKAGPD